MKYLNQNILCLEGCEFVRTDKNPDGLVPKGTYDALRDKSKLVVHGRGGNGNTVLIEYESLPETYKLLVTAKYGDPYEYMAKQPIRDLIKTDYKAIQFFSNFQLPDGRFLKEEHRIQYPNDAAIFNAFETLLADKKKLKATLNITVEKFWQTACTIVTDLKDPKARFPNSLPTSERHLKPLFKAYKADSYTALISGKYMNSNRRKVTDSLELLILTLYAQNNKPYAKDVHHTFSKFMAGAIQVVNAETGELFNPASFYKDGQPITISETTVWAYINNPENRAIVDKIRLSALEFQGKHRPHMHRHAPVFAFSKITMDDITIPFKMPDGTRVWSYQIFDVATKCVVGRAFGKDKNRGLFMKAVNDMFRTIHQNGWGIPAEIEIEQHISNSFADDLLAEGSVFPFVHFCRGGNPQEKRAEGFIKGKKYALQGQREGFQRRPFSKLEANRMNEDKDKVRYSYEDILANETADINEWNNTLHHDQVRYKGLTRWQVLTAIQNPDLSQPNPALLSRYIGLHTETSIYRSQYTTVKNTKYALPNLACLGKLAPNTLEVDAWYIPEADGTISQVHLFQNDNYICTCGKLATYNEARAEQTETDITIRNKQFGYRQSFDTHIKERRSLISKVAIVAKAKDEPRYTLPSEAIETTPEPVYIEPKTAANPYLTDPDYWKKKAISDL